MTIPAASLITLILTISLSASLELQPEIKVEGSPYFLAVFDLHKETDDDDNNCINLSAKGIDAMMALQWSNEYLNNNNQTNIGLLVYDACGSKKRAVTVIAELISPGGCQQKPEIAGVISVVSKDVQDGIRDILAPFGILHVGVSLEDYLTSSSALSLNIAGTSLWKTQATMNIVKQLKWSNIDVYSVNEALSILERNIFLKGAAVNDICAHILLGINITTALQKASSNAVIVFASDYKQLDDIITVTSSDDKRIFLIVTDSNVELSSQIPSNRTLFLKETGPTIVEMSKYLETKLTIVNETNSVLHKFMNSLPYCEVDNQFNHTVCNSDIGRYWEARLKDGIFINVISAYYNMFNVVSNSWRYGCTGYDFSKCPDVVKFVSVGFNPSNTPIISTPLNQAVSLEEKFPVILSRGKSGSEKIAVITDSNIVFTADMESYMPSECVAACPRCGDCFANNGNSLPIVIGKNGDVILTAGLPIYKDSTNGKCSEFFKDGIIMAQSFLYAIDTVKNMFPSENLLPGISVGGLVYDTCGGKSLDLSQLNQNSDCQPIFFSGKDNFTVTGKLVSDVHFFDSVINENTLTKPSTFSLSKFGLSSSPNFYEPYLDALLSFLESEGWTYVSIVYSEEFTKLEPVKNKISKMRKRGVCLSQEILISSSTVDDLALSVKNITTKTGAVILLSNLADTSRLMEQLYTNHFNFDLTNFIFFSWNAVANIPKGSVIITPSPLSDQTLKSELQQLSILDNGYYRGPVTEMNNYWWVKYHEHYHKCHASVDKDTLYPNPCTNQPTFPSNDIDDHIHKASLVLRYVNAVIFMLDKLYKDRCPSPAGTIACKEFTSYNNLRQYIETTVLGFSHSSEELSFSSSGTLNMEFLALNRQLSSNILVYTINSVTATKSGQVVAYDSANTSIAIKHDCSGWCPSCLQCQTSYSQTAGYYYDSGDIDVLGMFPIHTSKQSTYLCDISLLAEGSELLIESFLYALKTATTRYPYLLQNIKMGSLLVDTCSNIDKSLQTVSNFESCFASFSSPNGKMASPKSVLSYFLYSKDELSHNVKSSIMRQGKFAVSHFMDLDDKTSLLGKLEMSYARSEMLAITDFLSKMEWTYVTLVVSSPHKYSSKVELIKQYAKERSICIESVYTITNAESVSKAKKALLSNTVGVIVLFLSVEDIRIFFGSDVIPKVHIIGNTDVEWESTTANIQIPLGSIVIDRMGKVNQDLESYIDDVKLHKASRYGNPWLSKFLSERDNCPVGQVCSLPHDLMIQASSMVTELDILLHALHNRIYRICDQNGGLCKTLENVGITLQNEDFVNITLSTPQERLDLFVPEAINGAYKISNFQGNVMTKVGYWRSNELNISKEEIRIYSSSGIRLGNLPLSKCVGTCVCININGTIEDPEVNFIKDPEKLYFNSSGALNTKLWIVIVLAVACGGVAACLLFLFYVIYKTCVGLLNKRYIGLGILLLLSLMALYLSVLPYIFTPSEVNCAARHLLPSITYAIVYGTCLSKLMSLRAYKLIGLGGELSNLNQFLSVTFIGGIQIAISVQYVSMKGPFLEKNIIDSEETFSCKFDREVFVVYLIYDMLLIFICSLYALTVRKEKKNMGEAIFILISSWINVALWVAWVAVVLTINREYVELTICVGILVCATVTTATVFVPKLHKISKLKYDVKKSGVQNGGYKVDTDFMFERPHTLPGGFRNSYNMSPTRTNPKSISTFDSGLSY